MSLSSLSVNQSKKQLVRAVSPIVESLEGRVLFHAELHLGINFQPAGSAVPAGYLADGGAAFGVRGNGFSYGWDAANTTAVRDRNKLADQRYDTLTHTQAFGTRKWEIELANGQYSVHLVAGDPQYFDSVYKFNVENTLVVNGTPTTTSRFVEGTKTVNVTDGRLTITNATGSSNNKLAFIDIDSVEPTLPSVSVAASDSSASEPGTNTGAFTFTRTGDTTQPLIVAYNIAGTASNGSDYQQLLGSVTIPAGSATAAVTIKPIDDTAVEGNETVVLSIAASTAYTAAAGSATVNIADNDSSGLFSTKINFQPAAAPVPAGYIADGGNTFAARNGLSYGWTGDNTTWARDRNKLTDQRLDTLLHFNGKAWELAVPNGTYNVHIAAGDASYFDSVFKINAEGVRVIDGTPTTSSRFVEGTKSVTVADGRLTLTSASGSSNNKINFIEVTQTSVAPSLPTVTVSAPTTNASESGPTSRAFTITRTGSTAAALAVYFTIGGNATNGSDYGTINSPVTIPAGSASATVNLNPLDDASVESTETVLLTLVSQSAYTIGAASDATIRIDDNDATAGNTITWTNKASSPISRSEAMVAAVDGKMYVFGGYTNTTFTPTPRVDVYDPASDTWTQLIGSDMPLPTTHSGCTVIGHDVYLAGGYPIQSDGTGQNFSTNQVWKFNIDSKQWTQLPSLPSPRGGGGMTSLDGKLHFVAGADAARIDRADHWVLDLNGGTSWTAAAPIPTLRNHLGLTTLGGKIYAIGGQQNQDAAEIPQSAVEVYDATTNTWSAAAPMPFGRSHINAAILTIGDRIVTFGGETTFNNSVANVSAYDPATNTWSEMSPLPTKRSSGVAAFLNGEIYYSGGLMNKNTWKGVLS